jgi:glycosyltransferase involved in cell wall biosynthesis
MLVSTIIPTYNRAKDVVLAVESALAQTHPHQEILVCDDGSTDDTAQALARFGDKIRHLKKPNGGVSSARNFGIEHARGDAVAFLDSDDEWLPDKLAAQVEVLEARPDIDLVLTGIAEMDMDRRDTGVIHVRRRQFPSDGRILRDVLRNPAMCPSCAIVRTHVARAVGGFDTGLRTAEDLDFHLKVALRHGIAIVDRPLIRYTRAVGTLGGEKRTYNDYVFVMERFLAAHAGEIPREELREAAFGMYVRNARGLAHLGDVGAAAQLGRKAVKRARRGADVAALAGVGYALARSALRNLRKARQTTSGIS